MINAVPTSLQRDSVNTVAFKNSSVGFEQPDDSSEAHINSFVTDSLAEFSTLLDNPCEDGFKAFDRRWLSVP